MSISSNISAIGANQSFLNTTANNIANVNTEKFRPSDTRVTSQSGSPVAYNRVADDNGSQKSQTDLSKEIPDLIVAQNTAEVNVTAIKTQNEMFGTLLDIKA